MPTQDLTKIAIDQSRPQAGRQGAQVVQTSLTHSTKSKREDVLWPAIRQAQTKSANPQDHNEIWSIMQSMARGKTAPFVGETEDGLQYERAGSACFFSKAALAKRLNPERRRGKNNTR